MQSLSLPKLAMFTVPNRQWVMLLLLTYTLIFTWGLRTYLHWQSVNLVLGLVTLAVGTRLDTTRLGLRRYGYVAVVLLVCTALMPVKTILYLAILSGVFYLVESLYGKLNFLHIVTVLVMSPFFQYLSNIFLFPIRLYLSSWAGELLSFSGAEVLVQGNVLITGGQEFSVDPACMGLNMMVVSLLLALMLTGVFQKKYQLQSHWLHILGILLITFVLNIVSNLLRILLLVQFTILPGEAMHDFTGIICLLVYVVAPMFLLVKFSTKRLGRNKPGQAQKLKVSIAPHILLAALHVFLTLKVIAEKPAAPAANAAVLAEHGYAVQTLDNDVIKLYSDSVLIYLKPITSFYSADHSPMICWKGSGYDLNKINTTTVAGRAVYTAVLQKSNEVLYTCWWYDNGLSHTISQVEWRWQMLRGAGNYSIVNITSETEEGLQTEVRHFINREVLSRNSRTVRAPLYPNNK